MGNLFSFYFLPVLPAWLPAALANLAILLALGIAILVGAVLIRGILRIHWKLLTETRQVRIVNSGNVLGIFQIHALSEKNDLTFRYLVNGVPLAVTVLPKPAARTNGEQIAAAPRQSVPAASGATSAPQPAAAGPQAALPDDATKKQLAEAAKKAKGKGQAALGIGRIIIGILGTLGSLVPGEWGKTLKAKSAEMQLTSQDIGAKMQIPEQQMQLADSLKGQVGHLKSATGLQKPEDALQAAQAAGTPALQPEIGHPVETGVEEPVDEDKLYEYVETAAVPPEQMVAIELRIDPRDPYRTEDYPIRLIARQVPQAKTPAPEKIPNTVIDQVIPIHGISLLYKALTALLIVVAVAVNIYWVIVFMQWLAGLVG